MRYLQRFVRETEADVTTPTDIWRVLHYDGSIRNYTAELVHVSRSGPNLQCWRDAFSTTGQTLANLGRIAEVLYEDATLTTYYTLFDPYYSGEYKNYVFGKGFSQRSWKAGAHSAPAEIGGHRGVAAEECAGIGVQDFNGDEISGPSESGTFDVAPNVGLESDFSESATDVIVFGRRAKRCSESCQQICGSTFLDDVYAETEADGTVTPTQVPLGPEKGDRMVLFLSCTRCGRAYITVD